MYERFRALREEKELKQQVLADYLQCSQVCYSHYELGHRNIPTDTLVKLADFYDVSVDYLLNRTDNPKLNRK
ncbi:MAG: helix-turn-helix transcriptional regulator [Oscillospiraceae bacterium]